MTHLELQQFDPEDPGEVTREDFREATKLVSQAAKTNLKKTRMAFRACEDSGALRVSRKHKKKLELEETAPPGSV